MQEKAKNLKNMLITIGIIVVVIIAGFKYISRDPAVSETIVSSPGDAKSSSLDADLLAALSRLKSVKIDQSFFAGGVWASLLDSSKPLTPQEKGRPNPFAPIEGYSQGTTTSSF